MRTVHGHVLAAIGLGSIVLTLSFVYWSGGSFVSNLGSKDWLIYVVSSAGPWLVVLFLALAIIVSPIPSGPIAMASGALYGTLHGGLLVVVGAVLGAMIAFGLSRRVGREILIVSSNPIAAWITQPRSQNLLTVVVLGSRLIPFMSFDAISYAAGLTPLATWRFAVATGFGVVPVSFGFAAMGAGSVKNSSWAVVGIAACGVTVAAPIGCWLWRVARECVVRRVKQESQDKSAFHPLER